jgi:small subunit ribosomal protein S3
LGRKVHPLGFRIGVIRDWQGKWYADKNYTEFLQEDIKLRDSVLSKYAEAAIAKVDIDRQANEVAITIHTARPGIVIGRGGQRVDEMRQYLEKLIGKKVRLNIQEIRQPELDATLVSRSIAEQLERRIAYRRAMKQSMFRTMQAGARGIRILCSGRLAGAEIARRQLMHQGRVPLHTIRADVDYGFTEAHTTMGRLGIKVWIYKGDVLPEAKEAETIESHAPVQAPAAGVSTAVQTPSTPVDTEAKDATTEAS